MTLAELKSKADAVKIGGRVLPTDLETYQEMVFDHITQLCSPLNLIIPFRDSDIYRFIEVDEEGVEWFVRKPRIARIDTEYIDIDERLEMAFVYSLAAFVAADGEKESLEQRAERICVEYACEVLKMGLPSAKRVYEQESFIVGVEFDCVGRVYKVDASFVELVIDCLLCGQVCMDAASNSQLDLYRSYLNGDAVKPVDLPTLEALDVAVFLSVVNNDALLSGYDAERLNDVSTLFCKLGDLSNDLAVDAYVSEMNQRIMMV